MKSANLNVAVVLAAGTPKLSLFPNTYDPLIPINGIPAIKYILDSLHYFDKIFVVLNKFDKRSALFLELLDISNVFVIFAKNKFLGAGDSIFAVLDFLDESVNSVTFNLGDTIFQRSSLELSDSVLISKKFNVETGHWDYISDEGCFIEKPSTYEGGYITCGVYTFKDISFLKSIFDNFNSSEEVSIVRVLKEYSKLHSFDLLVENNDWFDLGHLDGYYSAKVNFLRKRGFNTFEYDSFRGIITKRSSNSNKIFSEINWYLNLPDDLKVFSPRLIDYDFNKTFSSYSIEFYGYPALSDLWLYGGLNIEHWDTIFEKLFTFVTNLEENYTVVLSKKSYFEVYVNKTMDRLKKLRENKFFDSLLNFDVVFINEKKFINFPKFIDEVLLNKFMPDIVENSKSSVIHGDLCFSNILYDSFSGLFKLIDPKGSFGSIGVFGDLNYDVAKLRHSVHGNYESIISDLFKLSTTKNEFIYSLLKTDNSSLINIFDSRLVKSGFDLNLIKLIGGLLFLTMIPLHHDSFERQKVMYLRSVELFNELEGVYFENCN